MCVAHLLVGYCVLLTKCNFLTTICFSSEECLPITKVYNAGTIIDYLLNMD